MADEREQDRKSLNLRQRRVARTLRGWVAGSERRWKQKDLADELHWSVGKLNNLLNAKTPAGPDHILAIAFMCGIPEDEWKKAWGLASFGAEGDVWWRSYTPGTVPDYFHDYLETEADATEVHTLEGMLIPGLLQTAEYTTAMVRAWLPQPDESIIRDRLDLRRKRQARLEDPTSPLRLHAIVSEAALRTEVGGATVMATQLDHLIERAALPTVTLQVLAADLGAYPGFGTAFHVLAFGGGEAHAVYIETLQSGLYVEDEEALKGYKLNFERLTRMALNPDASLHLINGVRREHEGRQGD